MYANPRLVNNTAKKAELEGKSICHWICGFFKSAIYHRIKSTCFTLNTMRPNTLL